MYVHCTCMWLKHVCTLHMHVHTGYYRVNTCSYTVHECHILYAYTTMVYATAYMPVQPLTYVSILSYRNQPYVYNLETGIYLLYDTTGICNFVQTQFIEVHTL
jgi:hypothetical protein